MHDKYIQIRSLTQIHSQNHDCLITTLVELGFKVHTRGGTLAGSHWQWSSNGTERIARMGVKSNPHPQPPSGASVHCMHIHNQ